MRAQPGGSGGGRWCATLCTLATGEVLAFQGHPRGDDGRHGNNTPERYQPLANHWVLLPAVGDVSTEPILYSRLHLLRDGTVFVSSRIPGFPGNIVLNPWTGATQEVRDLPDPAYHGFAYPSVLLPVVPEDGYQARVLLCGAPTSQLTHLGNPSRTWINLLRSGSTNGLDRPNSCATLLPTDGVLLTGGNPRCCPRPRSASTGFM